MINSIIISFNCQSKTTLMLVMHAIGGESWQQKTEEDQYE